MQCYGWDYSPVMGFRLDLSLVGHYPSTSHRQDRLWVAAYVSGLVSHSLHLESSWSQKMAISGYVSAIAGDFRWDRLCRLLGDSLVPDKAAMNTAEQVSLWFH